MPVIPEFQAEGTPGEAANFGIQGQNAASNWMTQAQNRAATQQEMAQRQLQIQQQQILQPVIQEQAKANILAAHAQIANATMMEQYRQQAAFAAPQAQQELLDASQLSDWDEQDSTMGQLQAKYAWMSQLPEYKGFTEALNEARAKAIQHSVLNQTLEAKQAQIEAMMSGRQDIAQTQAGARTGAAQIGAGARVQAAQIGGNARVDAAKIQRDQPTEIEKLNNHALALDTEAADPDTDPSLVPVYRQTALQLRQRAAILGRKTDEETATPAPKAPAAPQAKPAPAAKPPPKVTIDGKDYPVFKDKNGNLAYLKDGKYIDMAQQSP